MNFPLPDRGRIDLSRTELAILAALVIGAFLLFGFVVSQMVLGTDYAPHIASAEEMVRTGQITRTNFLYHLLVAVARAFVPFDYLTSPSGTQLSAFSVAGWGVAVVFYIVYLLVVYFYVRGGIAGPVTGPVAMFYAGFSLALIIVSPISLFTAYIPNLFAGYVNIAHYTNPTIILLKPFALLLFFYLVQAIPAGEQSLKSILITAGLLLAATLAKPNFTLCLLPLIALWCGYRYWHRQPMPWRLMLFGIGLPALALLAWQYYHRYIFDVFGVSMSIVVAPLATLIAHSANEGLAAWTLLPKFFLSILFPLIIYLCYRQKANASRPLVLAWALFGIGVFFSYTFAEYERATSQFYLAGDFLWCAQITLLVLFIVSARFWLEQIGPALLTWDRRRWASLGWRFYLCAGVFGLHLASGILWLVVSALFNQDARWH